MLVRVYEPAKAFSLPVMTIAPVPLSSSNLVRASFSSLKSGLDNALSAFGLFSVTLRTVSALLKPEGETGQIPKPTPGLGLDTIICSYEERRDTEAEYPRDNLGRDEERKPGSVFSDSLLTHRRVFIVNERVWVRWY